MNQNSKCHENLIAFLKRMALDSHKTSFCLWVHLVVDSKSLSISLVYMVYGNEPKNHILLYYVCMWTAASGQHTIHTHHMIWRFTAVFRDLFFSSPLSSTVSPICSISNHLTFTLWANVGNDNFHSVHIQILLLLE